MMHADRGIRTSKIKHEYKMQPALVEPFCALNLLSLPVLDINASNSCSQGCPNIFYDRAQRSEREGQFITLTEKNENQQGSLRK